MVNVSHEGGLGVLPNINKPMGSIAEVNGLGHPYLRVHNAVVGVSGVAGGALTVVSLKNREI